jgi:hypothetical protein
MLGKANKANHVRTSKSVLDLAALGPCWQRYEF